MRINARLDEESARKVRYLTRVTGSNLTGVVREAIDRYYRFVEGRERRALAIFEEAGFVGCAEGESDLSSRHDEILAEELEAKHGDR
jgi:hypothetical protein